jgi:DNA adenine methylase
MLSNSNSEIVRKLYGSRGLQIHEVDANRAINSKATGRGKIKELIITNY